ncbi:MarR family transcriptional regulator [uncultured Sphaerochaeta sp.]|uniref:MarR family winged helix-turn-helix transcriptional regulator n=1 Tax=uncultured Sphaerochaeta sp. TaxID=886478 RepID=UPI002A0A6B11|nr:MarR family transcriptional regulator [uncultured Sphaerochaeta sp.]
MQKTIESQLTALNQLYKKQDTIYHNLALRFGLSDAAFWVLYAVYESDQTSSQYDLSNTWFYSKQTINSAVATLVKIGFVQLQKSTGARNRKVIVLTETGQAFCTKAVTPLMEAEYKAFAQFSKEEREQYLSVFQKMLDLLQIETQALGE